MASSSRHWKSRDEWKKEKELEEARKAGTLAPEVDEEGKDINPHIPEYIKKAPWYLDPTNPSLKHQKYDAFEQNKQRHTHDSMGTWYDRGKFQGPAATKFRKGACQNCGAMTHTSKFCTERPRKKGAKWTGEDIRPDEIVKNVHLDYEGKRDRWNGYDAEQYKKVIDTYDELEAERQRIKAEEAAKKFAEKKEGGDDSTEHTADAETRVDGDKAEAGGVGDGVEGGDGDGDGDGEKKKQAGDDDDADDFRDVEEDAGRFFHKDPRSRASVRNLRIREDTAKYLRNLNPDSAFYDPKTRSMRANPNPEMDPSEVTFVGDNAARYSGDVGSFYEMQKFAWEAHSGQEIHAQASPSAAALAYQQARAQRDTNVVQKQQDIIKQYGGEQYLNALPKELIVAQTEAYLEYAPDGRLIKGPDVNAVPRSRYDEDIWPLNHTSVWGSYWEGGQWGYACCHQFSKNAYCTGPPPPTNSTNTTLHAHNDTPATSAPTGNVNTSLASTPTNAGAAAAPPPVHDAAENDPTTANSSTSTAMRGRTRNRSRSNSPTPSRSRQSSASSSSSEERRHRRHRDRKSSSRHRRSKDKEEKKKRKKKRKRSSSRSSSASASRSRSRSRSPGSNKDERRRQRKLKKYLEAEDRRKTEDLDERKRSFNSVKGYGDNKLSEEEMEAYRMKRDHWDDPMRNNTPSSPSN